MTKILIFDLGRVLVHIHPERAIQAMAETAGVSEAQIVRVFREIEVPFETGQLSTDQVLSRLLAVGGGDAETDTRERRLRLLRATFPLRFTPIGPVVELACRLGTAGVSLALASNTSPLDFGEVRARFPDILDPFGDRIYLSFELGVMKPDLRFYQAALAGLGVDADRCVFVDDREENVAGANAVGMTGIRFNGETEDVEALASLLAAEGFVEARAG